MSISYCVSAVTLPKVNLCQSSSRLLRGTSNALLELFISMLMIAVMSTVQHFSSERLCKVVGSQMIGVQVMDEKKGSTIQTMISVSYLKPELRRRLVSERPRIKFCRDEDEIKLLKVITMNA